MESVGFKEWALVCAAIGRGEQSVLLRKGGIAEGRDGFSFKHGEFFLFPTFFHEQVEKIRSGEVVLPEQRSGEIAIGVFVKREMSAVVTSWETAAALEPFHVLKSEVVRERFEYDDAPGIHLAFIRAYRLRPTWTIPELPAYGGCRSWVRLPELPLATELEPVLDDATHRALRERLEGALATTSD
ncbi:DUF1802 family protein [soil metagenome]